MMLGAYRRMVNTGLLRPCQAQSRVAEALGALQSKLVRYQPDVARRECLVLHECASRRTRRAQAAVDELEHEQTQLRDLVELEKDPSRAKAARRKTETVAPKMSRALEFRQGCVEAQGHFAEAIPAEEQPSGQSTPPKWIYLYGSVGTGKTMLMDMFCDNKEMRTMRVHFHAFNAQLMSQLHDLNTTCSREVKDKYDSQLLLLIAKSIAEKCSVLCFDEVQVRDASTATIMYQLIGALSKYGVAIVFTSNRAPRDLHRGVFAREQFEEFVELLEKEAEIIQMDSETDHRRLAFDLAMNSGTHVPTFMLNGGGDDFERMWRQTVGDDEVVRDVSVSIKGRQISIPMTTGSGVARLSFSELCDRPLGPACYLAMSKAFKTVFVSDIPLLNRGENRNQARRFISFVDAMYETKSQLVCTAAALPTELFVIDEGDTQYSQEPDIMTREMFGDDASKLTAGMNLSAKQVKYMFSGEEEVFAFRRCESRLMEMQSPEYLALLHRPEAGNMDVEKPSQATTTHREEVVIPCTPPVATLLDSISFAGKRHFAGGNWWDTIIGRDGARLPKGGSGEGRAQPSMRE